MIPIIHHTLKTIMSLYQKLDYDDKFQGRIPRKQLLYDILDKIPATINIRKIQLQIFVFFMDEITYRRS